jgi:hypothetical protein
VSDQRVRGIPHGQHHRLEDCRGNQRLFANFHRAVRADGKVSIIPFNSMNHTRLVNIHHKSTHSV